MGFFHFSDFLSCTDVPPQKLNPLMMSVPFDPLPPASSEEIHLDVTQWHHYQVDIDPGHVRWFVDGRLRRELHTPHAPHDVPVHLVVQAGVNPAIRDDWHDDFEWEQNILFRPLRAPQLPRA